MENCTCASEAATNNGSRARPDTVATGSTRKARGGKCGSNFPEIRLCSRRGQTRVFRFRHTGRLPKSNHPRSSACSERGQDPTILRVGRLSGKAMARTGLRMMPTFPLPPLKFRTAGFPRYGFKAGLSDGAFPASWFAIVLRALCCHRQFPALCQGRCAYEHLRASGSTALPQGPSLRSGLFCPGPSTLNRPHPPHSRAQPDFTVSRLIRVTFAVHIGICLGDPRLVLSFH